MGILHLLPVAVLNAADYALLLAIQPSRVPSHKHSLLMVDVDCSHRGNLRYACFYVFFWLSTGHGRMVCCASVRPPRHGKGLFVRKLWRPLIPTDRRVHDYKLLTVSVTALLNNQISKTNTTTTVNRHFKHSIYTPAHFTTAYVNSCRCNLHNVLHEHRDVCWYNILHAWVLTHGYQCFTWCFCVLCGLLDGRSVRNTLLLAPRWPASWFKCNC